MPPGPSPKRSTPAEKTLDIQVTATDAGLDVDVRGSGPLTAPLMTALARVAAQHHLARLTRHGELVAQARAPTLRMGNATVALPPAAFLQATAEGEAVAGAARAWRHAPAQKAWPTCSPASGRLRLRLAEQARVLAADEDEAAHSRARARRCDRLGP